MNSVTVHISEREELDLLTEQKSRAARILRNYSYNREFLDILNSFKGQHAVDNYFFNAHYQWIINTVNAYFDSIILDGCILFVSDGEKNFCKKLRRIKSIDQKLNSLGIKNNKTLQEYILIKAGIAEKDFNSYCLLIKNYRNNTVAHSDFTKLL